MDINVNVHFDENFVNALSDIAGCLAAISVANSGSRASPQRLRLYS